MQRITCVDFSDFTFTFVEHVYKTHNKTRAAEYKQLVLNHSVELFLHSSNINF